MKKIIYWFLVFSSLLIFNSCTDDKAVGEPGPVPPAAGHDHTDKTLNSWICKTMCEWYLWNEDVKEKSPNYSLGYQEFFRSLLSDNRYDGVSSGSYFSYIEREGVRSRRDLTSTSGFGFQVQTVNFTDSGGNSTGVYFLVQFVIEDSPAWSAGLRRGHWIGKVDGSQLNLDNYSTALRKLYEYEATGVMPTTVEITYYSMTSGKFTEVATQRISPGVINDRPIHHYEVLDVNGTKVGYLLYNYFERGNSAEYEDEMKRVFREFSEFGITELVLDLRYNPGGLVASCQLLSSIIAPEDKLGTKWLRMKYNEEKVAKDSQFDSWRNLLTVSQMRSSSFGTNENGVNLGLSKIYVIATGSSASASEILIHNLRGIGVTVHHIGATTVGKFVGMTGYSKNFDSYKYTMWPVTFYCWNLTDQTQFGKGLSPAYEVREFDSDRVRDFGDPNEIMLQAALTHIRTGNYPSKARSEEAGYHAEALGQSSVSVNRFGGFRIEEEVSE